MEKCTTNLAMPKHRFIGVIFQTIFTEEMTLITLDHDVERDLGVTTPTLDQLPGLRVLALVYLLGNLHVHILTEREENSLDRDKFQRHRIYLISQKWLEKNLQKK
jgi:hypothetical protein